MKIKIYDIGVLILIILMILVLVLIMITMFSTKTVGIEEVICVDGDGNEYQSGEICIKEIKCDFLSRSLNWCTYEK